MSLFSATTIGGVERRILFSGLRHYVAVACLASAVALAGCNSEQPTADHILLITVDTLRADHLGCYGYSAANTPVIDQLASESILFENAWSTSPLTLPSHASMLTGQLPFEHGLRNNDIIRPDGTEPMLQELLGSRGFSTSAVISAFVLDGAFGISQGFDHYVDAFTASGPQERRADEVTDIALGLLDELGDDPSFLWVHYFDPHHPYAEGFDSPIEGYDREIAFVDQEIGRLLESLKDRGLYDDTAIVLLSDHGEAFGEHGESHHGYFIYDVTTHVPMLLRLPGGEGGGTRRLESVSVTDIFPTLLSLAGVAAPEREHARNLLNPDPDPERILYAETLSPFANHGASPLVSARQGKWKYIEAPEPELYDRSVDAPELQNLHRSQPERALSLRAGLVAMNDLGWMTSPDPLQDVTSDPVTRERLAALGYVSSRRGQTSRWRPDPKLLIQVKAGIEKGDRATARGDLGQAETAYRQVLAQLPTDWKANWKLGDLLRQCGELEQAAQVYEKLVNLESNNIGARVRLANIRADQGRPNEALEQMDRCVDGAPSYLPGRVYRAELLQELERFDEARVELETVLRIDPSHERARRSLDGVPFQSP